MDVNPLLTPGAFVRHPSETEWGIGQVQSVDGARVTANFEHAGKQVMDARMVDLIVIFDP